MNESEFNFEEYEKMLNEVHGYDESATEYRTLIQAEIKRDKYCDEYVDIIKNAFSFPDIAAKNSDQIAKSAGMALSIAGDNMYTIASLLLDDKNLHYNRVFKEYQQILMSIADNSFTVAEGIRKRLEGLDSKFDETLDEYQGKIEVLWDGHIDTLNKATEIDIDAEETNYIGSNIDEIDIKVELEAEEDLNDISATIIERNMSLLAKLTNEVLSRVFSIYNERLFAGEANSASSNIYNVTNNIGHITMEGDKNTIIMPNKGNIDRDETLVDENGQVAEAEIDDRK